MNASTQALPSSARYRIASRIASGGMASVYIGIQRGAAGFKRPVAIKRAHPHLLQDPSFRDTILSEAKNASAVRHPNVVSIDDVEEVGGDLLLVTEYVEGASLSHILSDQKAIEPAVVARIVMDVCAALFAIHTAKSDAGVLLGLVHRDVSPQNILVGTDGVARITDFGIAKGSGDACRTNQQMRRGKFGYMAPEYMRASLFSDRSDIFALGVVLWEAVTGRTLFKRESPVDSIRLALEGRTPPASSINPAVPKALDRVIARCLEVTPGARFVSMRHLSIALEAAFPRLGTREEVTALVTGSAGGTLDEHRRAIQAVSCSLPPAAEHESDASEIRDEDILSAAFEPREADLFDEEEPFVPGEARLFDTVLPKGPLPAPPQRRSKASIALLAAFVAVLCGSTAAMVGAGMSESEDSAPVAR